MFTLEPQEYAKVSASLNSVPFNTLFAQAVVDGYMPGSVHVDDPKKPGACYVSHSYGMSLLFGETADEHFYARLVDHLVNSSGTRHADEWLQVSPRGWTDKIASLLGPRLLAKGSAAKVSAADGSAYPSQLDGRDKVVENTRLNFAFDPDLYARVALPSGKRGTRSGARTESSFVRSRVPWPQRTSGEMKTSSCVMEQVSP